MKKYYLLFLFCIALLTVSCSDGNKSDHEDNINDFRDYISFHSNGRRSISEPVEIKLAQPATKFSTDKAGDGKYLEISPDIAGEISISKGRILKFTPAEHFKPNTEYELQLHLKALFDEVKPDQSTFSFSFKTIKPQYNVAVGNLQSYDRNYQFITGDIRFSDITAFKKAKQIISAEYAGNSQTISWNKHDREAEAFSFTVDSVERKNTDAELKITWDGEPVNIDHKGEEAIPISGRSNFSIVGVESDMQPQSSVSINFSDPLKSDQDFSGLVSIEGVKEKDLRFETQGNVLKVYLSDRIIGNKDVAVYKGIKSTYGSVLTAGKSQNVTFEQIKPGVRLVSKGVILPNAKSSPLYFETVNLAAVDIRVIKIYQKNVLQFLQGHDLNYKQNYHIRRVGDLIKRKRILLDVDDFNAGSWQAQAVNLSELFDKDPGAIYRVELSFRKSYSTYSCDGEEKKTEEVLASLKQKTRVFDKHRENQYWNHRANSWRDRHYNWRERKNPCDEAYYNDDRFAVTNLLGSDLGLTVKESENNAYHFAANDILSTKPKSGVSIKLYDYQQKLITQTTTDNEGMTSIDSPKPAAFAVAQKNQQYAYVKLDDGNALSMSQFKVAGKELQRGLKGFVYKERGVHRPGDTVHLSFAFEDKLNPLPKNHPVKLEVTDPRGKLIQEQVLHKGEQKESKAGGKVNNGFYYFPVVTQKSDPTGTYNATIKVGGAQFEKSLRIETVKPNRLKIDLDFDDEVLSAQNPVSGMLSSTWLHGAPARKLKATMKVSLRQSAAGFEEFPTYKFQDPTREFDQMETDLLDQKLSNEGKLKFSKNIDIEDNAPGMLKATFLTKVFEGGGSFSLDVFSKKLAPFSNFVGIKSPEAHRYGSYYTDDNNEFQVVSLDDKGKVVPDRKLQVYIYRIKWRWWWNRSEDKLSSYANAASHDSYKEMTLNTDSRGRATFDMNIPEDDGGRYLIRVVDPESGHASGRTAYFYRNWWKRPAGGSKESAKVLVFSADKDEYDVGETAKVTFPSGKGGQALLSIENGTETLDTRWVEAEDKETTVDVPITEEMAPNVYINISLLQPYQKVDNDLPIRLYGVVPIDVNNPQTELHPELDMPDKLRPEQEFDVHVSEQDGKEMTYTLAVVDEGLLDLTRFDTPDIHSAFYSREALGVKTFDLYDDVIGAYSTKVDNIFAVGGGRKGANAKKNKADRFKPVVKFVGPFTLKPNQKRTHKLTMPNYIGSVKTMLVAGDVSKGAYGSTDKTTPVKKPLMVLASLPRQLLPGETVTLPVTVFAMEDQVKNAEINVSTTDALKPIGPAKKDISFDKPGEKIVNFKFKVKPSDKVQKVKIKAKSGKERSKYAVELDVENPNPISQKTKEMQLKGDKEKQISYQTFGVDGTNEAILEVSTIPSIDLERRLEELIGYPHGCLEQITSKGFPQLYLNDITTLTSEEKTEVERNINAVLDKLRNFQTAEGGFAYWPGHEHVSKWSTNYAGNFMWEAKQKGYHLPAGVFEDWVTYQKNAARNYQNGSTYNTTLLQAYRLYTLALVGKPALAAMNRLRESGDLSNNAKWRLAAAYALAGKNNIAESLMEGAEIDFGKRRYHYYGSRIRNEAMALETMVLLKNKNQRQLAESIAKRLSSSRWLSTQSTAYGLMAISKMLINNGGSEIDVQYQDEGKPQRLTTDKNITTRKLRFNKGKNKLNLKNKGGNLVYVTLLQKGKLPLGKELKARKNLSLNVSYYSPSGESLDVSKLRQGENFTAQIEITNQSYNDVEHIALTQFFPNGWEIVNTRFTDLKGGVEAETNYTDIRDDRVNYYFDLADRKSKTFEVELNASYLGHYYLPGAQAQAMYDGDYFSRNKGQWVKVVE